MSQLSVLSIFGTRPEAIKMIPVVKELQRYPDEIKSITCFTGQHRDLVTPILDLFEVVPDIALDVMRDNQSLAGLTSRLLTALDEVTQQTKPDWILAQGDTTSVMVASLLAYYHRVRFGHVEAGLRTGDKYQPFPEEGNRLIADMLADACFAPTQRAQENLARQGIPQERTLVTGNTGIDALQMIASMNIESPVFQHIPHDSRLVLVTAHRRENFGQPLENICHALRRLAHTFADVFLVYPVHPNPNVHEPVHRLLGDVPNILLLEPIDYPVMVGLMKRAHLILTDSGGIQEEAPTFAVPLLVMRETTERPEGVEAGVAELVGMDSERIYNTASAYLSGERRYSGGANPYGDGTAAAQIVAFLRKG